MKTYFLRFSFLPFFWLSIFTLKAQEGDYFLYNYEIPVKNVDNQNLAVVQDKKGVLYFANKKGILTYDGVSWEIINTTHSPHSLAISNIDKEKVPTIYVGCKENFGHLKSDKTGRENYVSLSGKNKGFGVISRIILNNKDIYFYSDKALFKVSSTDNKILQIWKADNENPFMGIAVLKNIIYVFQKNKGIQVVKNDKLELLPAGKDKTNLYIKTSFDFDNNSLLLGLSDNSLYLFDGKNLKEYTPSAQNYIKGNIINTGYNLGENEFALGTLSGGILIINKKTSGTRAIINYQTGLPDDEIYALCKDVQGGLWICHANGITRADMQLPVKDYSTYIGLEGNILSVLKKKDTLYVATGDGVFYLTKVEKYEEVESLIKKEQKYLKNTETVTRTVRVSEPKNDTRIRRYTHSEFGKKGEKRKIFISEESETKAIPTRALSTELSTAFFINKEARKAYAIQSIPYIYKKIKGLEAKCRQLLHFKDRILLASNLGLFEVNKEEKDLLAKPILPNEYINFIYPSSYKPDWVYVATNSGLFVMAYKNGNWTIGERQKIANTAVFSIVEEGQTVWIGAESQVFKFMISAENKLINPQQYTFADNYSEHITVRLFDKEPVFILSDGIYSYNRSKDEIYKNPDLQKYFNPRSSLLYNQAGYSWIKNFHWQNISKPKDKNELNTVFLELFENIGDIYIDENKNIWVVSERGLYQIDRNSRLNEGGFSIFLKNITNKKGDFLPLDKLVFDYDQNALSFTFKMASPFYRNEGDIAYQYWLEGLNNDWSDWDTKAIISFPYLPSGNYKLHVKARNVFGQISEEKIFKFTINPPFWQTWWFYSLEIFAMLALLYLSFLFNRTGRPWRVSFVLTVVALITLFEFISSYLEPYVDNFANGVPVFKLGMNIFLALSLLPIERFLRKWLLRRPSRKPVQAKVEAIREVK